MHADAGMMWLGGGKLGRSEEEARAAFDRPRYDRPRGPLPESQNRGQKPPWRDKPRFDRPPGPPKPGGRGGERQEHLPYQISKPGERRKKESPRPQPPWRVQPPGDNAPTSIPTHKRL